MAGTIDFTDWLDGPVFEPLREPAYFRRFFLDGAAIVWPNGADLAPESLYQRVVESASPAQTFTRN